MPRRRGHPTAWALAGLTLAVMVGGCRNHGGGPQQTGETDGDGMTEGSAGDDESGGAGPGSCDDGLPLPGAAPLRRLTHLEYDNTVRDLLGDDSQPSRNFPTDTAAVGFDNQASNLGVGALLAEAYMRAAEELAATAVADLDGLLPCDPSPDSEVDGEDACARELIDTLGMRAYRRPLSPATSDRLFELFSKTRDQYGFVEGIEVVVQTMLQSPRFLYRVELGMASDDAEVVRLDHFEMASRLSYLLWASMPDDELFDAAQRGELGTSAQIRGQAERMLEHPRARQAVASFHRQWLGLAEVAVLDKDPELFPELDDAFRDAMQTETLAFAEHVVFDGEGSLATLLTADYTVANAELAAFYEVAAPAGGGFDIVALDPNERIGVLGHASILAANAKPNQSSPVLRGQFVRERLLCQPLPEPPANVDTTAPQVDPDATTRERFEQHTSDPACASCHLLIDPIGFGLEHYDAAGRYRSTEGGLPIDATGVIAGLSGGDVSFEGQAELAHVLAERDEVRTCFVQQWFTYAHGRAPLDDDTCSVSTLEEAFADAGGDVKTLVLELTQTDAFLYRPAF